MSFTVTERLGSRDGTFLLERLQRNYVREFRVVSDGSDDDPFTVASSVTAQYGVALGLPYTLDAFQDAGALCQSMVAKPATNSRNEWLVTCSFASQSINPEQNNPEQNNPDPLLRPPEFTWSTNRFEKPIVNDTSDELVMNSAKQPFDPPPVMDDSRFVLTVTLNEESFDARLKAPYLNTLNEDKFFTFDIGLVKLNSVSAQAQFENDTFYWRTTYEFEFRPEGWKLSIADVGYYQRPGGPTDELVAMTHDRGFPLTAPASLNGSGVQLTGGDTFYREFTIYKSKKFADLNIPGATESQDSWEQDL
jgi:hypothetical protein